MFPVSQVGFTATTMGTYMGSFYFVPFTDETSTFHALNSVTLFCHSLLCTASIFLLKSVTKIIKCMK